MWKTVALYGLALALGALALSWLEYRYFVRAHTGDIVLFLIAAAFLGLGIWAGAWLFRTPAPAGFEPNTAALASLGITERELEVLKLIANGRSNKEIAAKLNLSPNTVKTHIANLFGKLEASRRTEALARARELALIP
jgi:DNA-binding CsgD family transcriptional regulator